MAIESGRRVVADASLVTRRIANETILVPVSNRVGDLDSIYTLTECGSRIWALLAKPVAEGEIVDTLCAEYDVAPDTARADVAQFIETLVSRKLARVVEEGP